MINKNKGIATIAILGIILGVLVVGGGAYYLGNSNGKKEVINPVVNVKESLPVEEEEKTNTDSKVVSDCDSNSKPFIKIISPNGGEVYKEGDKVTVKWESCTDPYSPKQVTIMLYGSDNNYAYLIKNNTEDSSQKGLVFSVPNIGSHIITIPLLSSPTHSSESPYSGKFIPGKNFTIRVSMTPMEMNVIDDYSDNSFTINSASNVSTANWKTYTNKVLGIKFNYPSNAKLEEVKLGRTDLKSGEVIIRLPFVNQYDAWTSKLFTVTSYNDSCKEYLPTSISQKKTINGVSYVFVDPEWGATSGMSTISKWRKYYHESSSKCYIISETLSGLGNNERPSTATVPPNVDKFLESELVDLDKIMSSVKIF